MVLPDRAPDHGAVGGHVDALARFYESLRPESLDGLGRFYADEARFRDPFNDVSRLPEIRAIFEHMFRTLEEPRFEIVNRVVDGDQAMLEWVFTFRVRRFRPATRRRVHGVSHVRFGPDGRVIYHRDYWDTGEELYAHLPVIGMLWRRLRAALATPRGSG
ncbi:MAG: nuclear transport factor 2 family protein [Betaproteobacteria bacterium]|nr:nuclear transport factor 2 family protein [Betaproteobacteria bacterium]